MFIATRIGFMNEVLYYQEDTKWTSEKSKSKKFDTKKEALKESDRAGLYELIIEEVK